MSQFLGTVLGALIALSGVGAQLWYQSNTEQERSRQDRQKQVFEIKRITYGEFLHVANAYAEAVPRRDRKQIDTLFNDLAILRDRIALIADPDVVNTSQELLNKMFTVEQNKSQISDEFFSAKDDYVKAARVELGIQPYVRVPPWRQKNS